MRLWVGFVDRQQQTDDDDVVVVVVVVVVKDTKGQRTGHPRYCKGLEQSPALDRRPAESPTQLDHRVDERESLKGLGR